jgi:SH3-like domain-containing protein
MFALSAAPEVSRARAQTGTLQLPAHHQAEVPPKPPTAVPRTPVHEEGRSASHTAAATKPVHKPEAKPHHTPVVKPPVVKPHGAEAQKLRVAPAGQAQAVAKPAAAGASVAAAAAVAKPPAPATPKAEEPAKPDGPKVPRFAALRSDEVNLRSGPGTRYPIQWVYKRRDLPVEIERDFEVWRLVRDMDGIRGWMHQATLTGRRTFVVIDHDATLRSRPQDTASAIAVLKVGVIGRIRRCEAGSAWCQMQAGPYRGYLRRDQVWGVLPDEVITP